MEGDGSESGGSTGLSFHLVDPEEKDISLDSDTSMDPADLAVVGGSENFHRRSRRLTQDQHQERVLFESRMKAVEDREGTNAAREEEHGNNPREARQYSFVSPNIRELIIQDKIDAGCTYKEINRRYGVNESTACRIVQNFFKRGNSLRKPVGGYRRGERIISEDQKKWLKTAQIQHNDWTLKQLQEAFVEEFPNDPVPSISTFSRELGKMNFTEKVLASIAVERNFPENGTDVGQ